MIEIYSKNIFKRVICLFLTTVFLSSFPTGATALALCLDEDENHIVDQSFYLADCHSSVDADLLLSDKHRSVFAEKENNDCTDVSLSNANILNRPSKIFIPAASKVILSYILPQGLISFQQKIAAYSSAVRYQPLFVLPVINAHQTVVLLI